MNKAKIESFLLDFIDSDNNRIPSNAAHEPELAGLRMFDEPILAYGDALDRRFDELKDIPQAHAPLMPPRQWLPFFRH